MSAVIYYYTKPCRYGEAISITLQIRTNLLDADGFVNIILFLGEVLKESQSIIDTLRQSIPDHGFILQ